MGTCLELDNGCGWERYTASGLVDPEWESIDSVDCRRMTHCWWNVYSETRTTSSGLGTTQYVNIRNEFKPLKMTRHVYKDEVKLLDATRRVAQAGVGVWYNRRGLERCSGTDTTGSHDKAPVFRPSVSAEYLSSVTMEAFNRHSIGVETVKDTLLKSSSVRPRLPGDASLGNKRVRGFDTPTWSTGACIHTHRIFDRVDLDNVSDSYEIDDAVFLSGESATPLGLMYLWNNATATRGSGYKVAIDVDEESNDGSPTREPYVLVTETSKVTGTVCPVSEGVPEPSIGPLKAASMISSILTACESYSTNDMTPLTAGAVRSMLSATDCINRLARHARKARYHRKVHRTPFCVKQVNSAAELLGDLDSDTVPRLTAFSMRVVADVWNDPAVQLKLHAYITACVWKAIIVTAQVLGSTGGGDDERHRTKWLQAAEAIPESLLEREARRAAGALVLYADNADPSLGSQRRERIKTIASEICSSTPAMIVLSMCAGFHYDTPPLSDNTLLNTITHALNTVRAVALGQHSLPSSDSGTGDESDESLLFDEFTDALLSVCPSALYMSYEGTQGARLYVHESPLLPLTQNTALAYAAQAGVLVTVLGETDLKTMTVQRFLDTAKKLVKKLQKTFKSPRRDNESRNGHDVSLTDAKKLFDLSGVITGFEAAMFFKDPKMTIQRDVFSRWALDSVLGSPLAEVIHGEGDFVNNVIGLLDARAPTEHDEGTTDPLHGTETSSGSKSCRTKWWQALSSNLIASIQVRAKKAILSHENTGPFEERPFMSRDVALLFSDPRKLVDEMDLRALLHALEKTGRDALPDSVKLSTDTFTGTSITTNYDDGVSKVNEIPVDAPELRRAYREYIRNFSTSIVGDARAFFAIVRRCPVSTVPFAWAYSTLKFTWSSEQDIYASETLVGHSLSTRVTKVRRQWPLMVSQVTKAHFERRIGGADDYSRVRMRLDTDDHRQEFNCSFHTDFWVYGLPQSDPYNDPRAIVEEEYAASVRETGTTPLVLVSADTTITESTERYAGMILAFSQAMCASESALYEDCFRKLLESDGAAGLRLCSDDVPIFSVGRALHSTRPPKEEFTGTPCNSLHGRYIEKNRFMCNRFTAAIMKYVATTTGSRITIPSGRSGSTFAMPEAVDLPKSAEDGRKHTHRIVFVHPQVVIAQKKHW